MCKCYYFINFYFNLSVFNLFFVHKMNVHMILLFPLSGQKEMQSNQ